MIGQGIRRREDPRSITGNGQYVDDLTAADIGLGVLAAPFPGVRHIDIPANGERVWRAIQDARPQ